MRRGFQVALEQYGKFYKEHTGDDASSEDMTRIIDYYLASRARETTSSSEAQKEIFVLQVKKQKIMEELKGSLRDLDAGESGMERLEGQPLVYEASSGFFYFPEDVKKQIPITLGEMLNDLEWEVFYVLDKSIPRLILKEYLIARTKHQLRDLLDEQILDEETTRKRGDFGRREAYCRTKASIEVGEIVSGWLAETAVRCCLEKLVRDLNLDFSVDWSDVFLDVDYKIDFIIRRPKHDRGVRIEDNGQETDINSSNDLGIQFTISQTDFDLRRKTKQLKSARARLADVNDSIADIVLVSIPLKDIKKKFASWQARKKLTGYSLGGLDSFFGEETINKLVEGILNKFLSADKIEIIKRKVLEKKGFRLKRLAALDKLAAKKGQQKTEKGS